MASRSTDAVRSRWVAEIENITWGPPPPRPETWKDRLAPFLERPGEWGRLAGDYDRRIVSDLRLRHRPIPPGEWEFECRPASNESSRRIHIWARYLGER